MDLKEKITLHWMKQNSLTLQERFWRAMEEYSNIRIIEVLEEINSDNTVVTYQRLKNKLSELKQTLKADANDLPDSVGGGSEK